MENEIICQKYECLRFIGRGNFGMVFEGRNRKTDEKVAIKLEPTGKLLRHETQMLNYLFREHCTNIPRIYWYGIHRQEYSCLVITYYEYSLTDYIKKKGTRQISSLMGKIFDILENVHQKHVIHRDVKPENIMIKNGDLHLIDFGLATFIVDAHGNYRSAEDDCEHLVGTPLYVSYPIHCGKHPGRRDDLISLGYVFLNFVMEELPWKIHDPSSITEDTNLFSDVNFLRKKFKSIEYLDRLWPTGTDYFRMCYALSSDQTPDYNALKKSLCNIYAENP